MGSEVSIKSVEVSRICFPYDVFFGRQHLGEWTDVMRVVSSNGQILEFTNQCLTGATVAFADVKGQYFAPCAPTLTKRAFSLLASITKKPEFINLKFIKHNITENQNI